jgi:hypothetical protein
MQYIKFTCKGYQYTFMVSQFNPTEKDLDYRGVLGGDHYRLVSVHIQVMRRWGMTRRIQERPLLGGPVHHIDNHWRNLTGKVRREVIAKVRKKMVAIFNDQQ